MRPLFTRRALTLGALGWAGFGLAGCAAFRDMPVVGSLFEHWPRDGSGPVVAPDYDKAYGALRGERHPVPAFDYAMMDPRHLRAEVAYRGPEAPGTIVVEPGRHLLYLVAENGRALRYGIGTGPEARGRSGIATIGSRQAWPDWTGPADGSPDGSAAWAQLPMRVRVQAGRRDNPLGARALGLVVDGRAIGYRIHGTPEPETIGTDVATGCIRMIDQDIVHLDRRIREDTPVVVLA